MNNTKRATEKCTLSREYYVVRIAFLTFEPPSSLFTVLFCAYLALISDGVITDESSMFCA